MTHSAPYLALLMTLADQEPRWGYTSPLEIPRLTAADTAVVWKERRHEVEEGATEAIPFPAVIENMQAEDFVCVGASVAAVIAESARFVIWPDLQEFCEKRRESDEQVNGVGLQEAAR